MAENIGWISLHRQIQNHWVWQDSEKLKCWLDILFTVNVEDKKINIGVQLYECKRGQSLLSIQSWASRWRLSKSAARNLLNLFQNAHMITLEPLSKSTRLTVCNYDTYQHITHDRKPVGNLSETDRHTQLNKKTSKQVNNINNKLFIAPTVDEVRLYFIENGYSPMVGEKAHKYYDTANWKDSKGSPVKNWKQKMISVWFKDENKILELELSLQRKWVP